VQYFVFGHSGQLSGLTSLRYVLSAKLPSGHGVGADEPSGQ